MSLPKKGTRKIKINGRIFLYRVSRKSGYLNLTIQAEESQLLVFSVPFIDGWLRLGLKPEERDALFENEVELITPSFVEEVIRFGLSNDWLLQNKNQPYRMTFIDGEFKKNKLA